MRFPDTLGQALDQRADFLPTMSVGQLISSDGSLSFDVNVHARPVDLTTTFAVPTGIIPGSACLVLQFERGCAPFVLPNAPLDGGNGESAGTNEFAMPQ